MKKHIIYTLMLCIAFCMSACHCDDEDDGNRITRRYPKEEQIPFDKENIKGELKYDKKYKKWCFRPDPYVYKKEFIPTIDFGVFVMFVENMIKEYESLAGRVAIDGTYVYLYDETPIGTETSDPLTTYFYSLKIKKISREDGEYKEEDFYISANK